MNNLDHIDIFDKIDMDISHTGKINKTGINLSNIVHIFISIE